jgi:hypothetical protein
MNLQTDGKAQLTTKGEVKLSGSNDVRFTFSPGNGFHAEILKTAIPLILLVTLCACVLHWVGVM